MARLQEQGRGIKLHVEIIVMDDEVWETTSNFREDASSELLRQLPRSQATERGWPWGGGVNIRFFSGKTAVSIRVDDFLFLEVGFHRVHLLFICSNFFRVLWKQRTKNSHKYQAWEMVGQIILSLRGDNWVIIFICVYLKTSQQPVMAGEL